METKIKVKEKQYGEMIAAEVRIIFIQVSLNTSAYIDYGVFSTDGFLIKKPVIEISGDDYMQWEDDEYIEDYILNLEELERE